MLGRYHFADRGRWVGLGLLVATLGLGSAVSHARAESATDAIARGKLIAETNCAACHAIGVDGDSPNEKAPPFRTLHTRYNVEHLEEALAEGIVVGHGGAEMPVFEFEVDEINAFIAYLKSLEPPGSEG